MPVEFLGKAMAPLRFDGAPKDSFLQHNFYLFKTEANKKADSLKASIPSLPTKAGEILS